MIDAFSNQYVVTRQNKEGQYILGKYEKGSTVRITMFGTIEPLTGTDILMLPEGERTKESIRIYTNTELHTANEALKIRADLVTYCGKTYEVQIVKRWDQLIPHFAVVAVFKNDTKAGD